LIIGRGRVAVLRLPTRRAGSISRFADGARNWLRASRFYASWRTQGRLLPGSSVRLGSRVLIFDGDPGTHSWKKHRAELSESMARFGTATPLVVLFFEVDVPHADQ
jgi:hypothetical protein